MDDAAERRFRRWPWKPRSGAATAALFIRPELRGLFPQSGWFEWAESLAGEVFREAHRRRTLRVVLNERVYFLKLHYGVGWREILKNWLVGKRPALGAENEHRACRHLERHGLHAPRVAAFAREGGSPASRRSLILCHELAGCQNLEAFAKELASRSPPSPGMQQRPLAALQSSRDAPADAPPAQPQQCPDSDGPPSPGPQQQSLAALQSSRAALADAPPAQPQRRPDSDGRPSGSEKAAADLAGLAAASCSSAARRLLVGLADFVRQLHAAGLVHRDLYLCHLLLHLEPWSEGRVELAVLDLHRAQVHARLPKRWRKRDLAALLFSALDLPLHPYAWLRFVRIYTGQPLRSVFQKDGAFWRAVHRRALKLRAKESG